MQIWLYAHSWSPNDGNRITETSKTINFWSRLVYKIVIYWIAILFIGITFFYWQVFLRRVKATNETTTLLNRFAYNMTLYCGNGHNFSLVASTILVKDFAQMIVFVWKCTNH